MRIAFSWKALIENEKCLWMPKICLFFAFLASDLFVHHQTNLITDHKWLLDNGTAFANKLMMMVPMKAELAMELDK